MISVKEHYINGTEKVSVYVMLFLVEADKMEMKNK